MITLKSVSKSFSGRKVLSDISLQINPGEFVCIIGRSGAGKSTLVHLIAGAEEVSSGTIEVDGVKLHAIPPMAMRLFRRRVGIVFQDGKLLSHLTVRENIAFPLEVCCASDQEIRKRVAELMRNMDLVNQAESLPYCLSGGEKARTAIARAIVHRPMVILLDEPTGNLDPEQSKQILALLQKINKDGTTVILATHDAGLVDSLQTRVVSLENGRITRDSAGGYRTVRPQPHKLLGDLPTPPPDEAAAQPKPRARKVRVTSINS
ncbi:MAG: ATP-binding cassette domain-containing protein [Candidatus Peribacteraceae bacterium]|nr:ATP-binding cassette domain-containing protein [Candidatus Peribacteraceae bacterium]